MKCQKCAKPAVVHLTEVVTPMDGAGSDAKRTVEIHLCLNHAVEAGLLTPSAEPTSQTVIFKPEGASSKVAGNQPQSAGESAAAIVPAPPEPSSLAVSRGTPTDAATCPMCGMNWNQFKQAGLMGCPHDYEQFGSKLTSLLKRAQEGATEHMGKVPRKKKTVQGERQIITLRLRRELQQAVDTENYEQAARLRDQLRQLEQAPGSRGGADATVTNG